MGQLSWGICHQHRRQPVKLLSAVARRTAPFTAAFAPLLARALMASLQRSGGVNTPIPLLPPGEGGEGQVEAWRGLAGPILPDADAKLVVCYRNSFGERLFSLARASTVGNRQSTVAWPRCRRA